MKIHFKPQMSQINADKDIAKTEVPSCFCP